MDGKRFDNRFAGLQSYRATLFMASCVWILQAAGIAVMVCDLLVTPAIESFCWSTEGSLRNYRIFGSLLMAALAMPRLTDTCTVIVNGRHELEKKSN